MTLTDNNESGSSSVGLSGIRVLELGQLVSAPYATKLLADLGAEVIKVEPPEGDPARHRGPFRDGPDVDASGLFLGLNTNKTSVVIEAADDTDDGAGDRLAPLLDNADILITNYGRTELSRLGIDLDDLADRRPDLVICSITPFGRSGPYAEYQAEELTIAHAGGWAYQCPGATDESSKPPLKVFGHQTDFHAGVAAAMASLAAFDRAERTGQGELIDLSTMAHTVGMLEAALIAASYMDENPSRLGSRLLNPWGIFPCRDGLIFLVTVEPDQWARLVSLMGSPEWAETGLFDTTELRLENEDLLTVYLKEWTSKHSVEELWHLGQSERICFAPVLSMSDLENQAHLKDREFIVEVDHPTAGTVKHLGPPFKASNNMWGPLQPAPGLDATTTATFGSSRTVAGAPSPQPASQGSPRPLEGLRVLDLSWVWAGPYAGLHLAFLGAEVVKVESSLRPGLGRRLPLHPTGLEPTLNTSAYFNQWEQAKLSCELDLSQPDSIAIVKELAGVCDVVIENFATGVMDRLGLSFDELRAVNPNIIVASISGYGSEGRLQNYMGYGPTTGPLSGLTSLTGHQGGPPEELGISFGDPAAGMMAAFAICSAVVAGRASGEACYLDVALWEATASNAVEGWMAHALAGRVPERMGNRDPLMAPHGCYPAAPKPDDGPAEQEVGRWISIACADDQQWQRMAGLIDPALAADTRFREAADRKRNEDELDALVSQWTAQCDRWTLTEQLQSMGIAAFPSMSPQDLLVDPHLWERGFFEQLEHPEVGRRVHAGVPWLMSNSPNGVSAPAPLLGQHTEEVLGLVGRTAIPNVADTGA